MERVRHWPDLPIISLCCLLALRSFRGLVQGYALRPGANLHLFTMIRLEACFLLWIGLGQSQLFTILVAFLDAHELLAIDILVTELRLVRGVCAILNPITILGRTVGLLVDPITISHAIPIEVRLAALDLGAVTRLVRSALLALSFRETGQRTQRHRGDDQCAYSINSSHVGSPSVCAIKTTPERPDR
jgi:hypothetical protein